MMPMPPPRPGPPSAPLPSASAALEDLRDCPAKLRLLADWHDARDSAAIVKPVGHEVQADLRRWAADLDRLLMYRPWKGMVAAAQFAGVGVVVGLVIGRLL